MLEEVLLYCILPKVSLYLEFERGIGKQDTISYGFVILLSEYPVVSCIFCWKMLHFCSMVSGKGSCRLDMMSVL